MFSKRQNQISRLIQKELAVIFQQKVLTGAMVTVTIVRISKDLSYSKVYLSIFGAKDKHEVLSKIKKRGTEIRRQLAMRVKNQLRKTPELEFFIDDSMDYSEHIDQLLNQ